MCQELFKGQNPGTAWCHLCRARVAPKQTFNASNERGQPAWNVYFRFCVNPFRIMFSGECLEPKSSCCRKCLGAKLMIISNRFLQNLDSVMHLKRQYIMKHLDRTVKAMGLVPPYCCTIGRSSSINCWFYPVLVVGAHSQGLTRLRRPRRSIIFLYTVQIICVSP